MGCNRRFANWDMKAAVRDGDADQHIQQVLVRRPAGSNTWNKPVLALQVLGDVLLLENDQRVKEGERDDHDEVQQPVERARCRVERVVDSRRDGRNNLDVAVDEVT